MLAQLETEHMLATSAEFAQSLATNVDAHSQHDKHVLEIDAFAAEGERERERERERVVEGTEFALWKTARPYGAVVTGQTRELQTVRSRGGVRMRLCSIASAPVWECDSEGISHSSVSFFSSLSLI